LEPESLLQKPSYPSEHLYSLHNWDAPVWSRPLSVISYQLSGLSYQLVVISYQLSGLSFQLVVSSGKFGAFFSLITGY
jgi:hypothetical protein